MKTTTAKKPEQRQWYVVDAIDTVTAKLHLAQECRLRGIPLITCLGTGNRLDPSSHDGVSGQQKKRCG